MEMLFKKKILLFVLALGISNFLSAQIHSGKITYERKTNIYKRFKLNDIKKWVPETDKIKTDNFILFFNDSLSYFEYQESELKDLYSWASSQSYAYMNLNSKKVVKIKDVSGDRMIIKDSLKKFDWKITDAKRNIGGYLCRKAYCKPDDSTIIYAWYCLEVIPSVGPEAFSGLPGAILGLATEDGGVVFFAKSVEKMEVSEEKFRTDKLKGKVYEIEPLKAKLEKQFGDYNWGKNMIRNLFSYL